MKTILITSIISTLLLSIAYTGSSQPTTRQDDYPSVIQTEADSFYVTGPNWPTPFGFAIGKKDTMGVGSLGYRGSFLQLITQEDTVQFDYISSPYQQNHTIHVVSPRDTTVCIIMHHQHSVEYSDAYIEKHEGKVQFVIPETFELANVIWTLSPRGQRASNLRKEGRYYQEVMTHFAPYLDHAVFDKLQFSDSAYFRNYYSFRDNSICFQFQGDSLLYSGPYYLVFGNYDPFGGLFKELHPFIEDFAQQSNYRQFYQAHLPYYHQLIERQRQLMPVAAMWSWLEEAFPNEINAYKVVFSPLVGSSHSTQIFYYQGDRASPFWEAVMFTSGPEATDENQALTEREKEGLLSGVVFTEIDHNYVNPVTSKYKDEVEKVFSDRTVWTQQGGDTDHYPSPEAVFNEYMTHAVFCLYIQDTYDEESAKFIINSREKLMTERRHFVKFPQFNKKLTELYESKSPDESVADLYPKILAWAKTVD